MLKQLIEALARWLQSLRDAGRIDTGNTVPPPPPIADRPYAGDISDRPSPPAESPKPSPAMLTQHFSLEEMTASDDARRLGIDNDPPIEVVHKLRRAAHGMERVRILLGNRPIIVTSGYRCADLNAAVGGSKNSAHMQGYAVDFKCPAFGSPLQIARVIEASDIFPDVDQLIHEFGAWVHISFDPRKRNQTLTINATGARIGLHP